MNDTLNIPEDYQTVMPYLIVENASGFIDFTKSVFGARERMKHMRNEHIIAHAEISIGGSTIMFADSIPGYPPRASGFFIYVHDADKTYADALSAGATVITPLADQEYGRSGGVLDPFGNTWWITSVISK